VIPVSDPGAGYRAHRRAIDAAVRRVLASGRYVLGPEVLAFEAEFAAWVGVAHGVGVASGTDAIELALRACGVGRGELVFTVSHTATATVAAIERSGATPVLVDVDARTLTLDPERLDEAVRRAPGRPRAVVPVHLYGHPCDMPAILDVARRHDLVVVEDCAQAHGAERDGRRAGTFGHMAAFSFYPTKNLGALGDGGMVVSADAGLAERVRALREYGWKERYVSSLSGVNSRLDELQAAVLRVRLARLDGDNARRAELAEAYRAGLSDGAVALPESPPGCRHAWHLFVVRTPERELLRRHLEREGVGTAVHYPVPVHLQPAYRASLRDPSGLARTERAAREVLSLPLYPELAAEDARSVVAAVRRWSAAEP
jgi:dTDP-4-amino-4,6-dideoxygalactose transaminase